MTSFFSKRFDKNVWITHHANISMKERGIEDTTLERIIEKGTIKWKNKIDFWIYMNIPGRTDNLVCAAVLESTALVVKTVMINWKLEDET